MSNPKPNTGRWVGRSHINSNNQVRGHRTGSSDFGVAEYPREKTNKTKTGIVHVYIIAEASPNPPESIKVKSDVSVRTEQAHTDTYDIRFKTRS